MDAPTPFFRLIYRSRMQPPVVLEALAVQAQRHNPVLGITGGLAVLDGTFLQYLEGTEVAVRSLFDRIAQDARHREVQVLMGAASPAGCSRTGLWRASSGTSEPKRSSVVFRQRAGWTCTRPTPLPQRRCFGRGRLRQIGSSEKAGATRRCERADLPAPPPVVSAGACARFDVGTCPTQPGRMPRPGRAINSRFWLCPTTGTLRTAPS